MRDIQAIITDYWNCAYQQGLEYREHDDEKGTAQRLEDELQAWVAAHSTPPTYAQGQEDAEHFQKALAHIEVDRLGSYTFGRWTLTACLTPEEVGLSHYRAAREQGQEEMRERAAKAVEERGKEVKGAIDPTKTAWVLRAMPIKEEGE